MVNCTILHSVYIVQISLNIEPEVDNVTVASIVTANNHSVVTIEWIVSSDVYVDTFTLNYTAMCDSIALMCMNNTVENITTNNITFSDWILGIDYEVLLWAENVIGSGQTLELYIEQEQKGIMMELLLHIHICFICTIITHFMH